MTHPDWITLCSCGEPLLETYEFPGCELYCQACRKKGGLFDIGEDVPSTPHLINRKKELLEAYQEDRSRRHRKALCEAGIDSGVPLCKQCARGRPTGTCALVDERIVWCSNFAFPSPLESEVSE